MGIAPPYISRVSNISVLAKASHVTATEILKKRRLQLFGKILRCPGDHPLRNACFVANIWIPVTDRYVRRVGRPCKEWVKEVMNDTLTLFGCLESAVCHAVDKTTWDAALLGKMGF